METFILLVVALSALILIHEWGHFYSARRFGIKVEEFGFGFPPRIFSRVKNGVRYSFNLLPFGGFVKIFGEHGEGENDQKSFVARPAWQRFVVLAAGVFMNLVLAWVLFSAGSAIGVPQIAEDHVQGIPVSIIAVLPDSPAASSGLRIGDIILELRANGDSLLVEAEQDVQSFVAQHKGEVVTLVIERTGQVLELASVPREGIVEGEGPLGIALARLTVKQTPWYWAPIEGAQTLIRSVVITVAGLWAIVSDIVSQGRTAIPVSGPVGIFTFANDTRSLGIAYVIQFVGLLSVNLAILNFLPIPALDGGRILFLLIEKVRGYRIDPKVENFVHTLGFAFLIFIMILVTYQDIVRIW